MHDPISLQSFRSFPMIPRVKLIEIDLSDNRDRQALAGGLPAEVMHNELFISGMEAEARWQVELCFGVSGSTHLCNNLER
ncbi:hypothetical protein DsansV1_C01g0004451 [Dioscorea sansibarensis]